MAHELAGLSKLREMSMRLVHQPGMQDLLNEFVLATIELTHADVGNMQSVDENGTLKIIAQYGF